MTGKINWSHAAISRLFERPLLDLVFQAAAIHRRHHNSQYVQLNKLISVKTGGCPEDCAYCPQSARYKTEIKKHGLMSVEQVCKIALDAKQNGVSRLCLGAAWRDLNSIKSEDFEKVLEMIRQVAAIGIEVCCTMGMLTAHQAHRLKAAGITAYNHNLDTSPEYYKKIINTRSYSNRLQTLKHIQSANISVCCGGIIGMGETISDRATLLFELANLNPPPDSVPINALIPIAGTPLAHRDPIKPWDVVRMIAATRIVLPKAMVRLSAGRKDLSPSDHALCFLAGANSIFYDDKLLTAPNPDPDHDDLILKELGLSRYRDEAV